MRRSAALALAFGLALVAAPREASADVAPDESVVQSSAAPSALAPEAPAAAAGADVAPLEDPQAQAEELLADPRYVFCHDQELRDPASGGLCRFASGMGPSCRAYAEACAAAPPEPEERRLPPWARTALTWALWLLLGAGALYVALQIHRHFRSGRAEVQPRPSAAPGPSLRGESPPPVRVVDRDAARLLAAARDALARGDTGAALRLAHAALVRALESAGLVHVERSATNGDYARALEPRPELHAVFRDVARELERVEFGRDAPPRARLAELIARVDPVVQRLVAIVALLLATGPLGCSVSSFRGTRDDAPGGSSLLLRLLEARGTTATRRLAPIEELPQDGVDAVLVDGAAELAEEDWAVLSTWVSDGGVLVIAGFHAGAAAAFDVGGLGTPLCAAPPHAAEGSRLPRDVRLVGQVQELSPGPAWHVEAACGTGALVATRDLGTGRVVLLADPDFLTNASLAAGDHARVLFALVGQPDTATLVDRLVAAGATSPYRAIANSGLLPFLLHFLGWLCLWAVARGASFGVPRDPVDPPRRAFADHVRAVARLHARAGSTRHALGLYAGWALDRLATRLAPGAGRRLLDVGAAIAARTGRPEAEVARVLAEAADARDRPGAAASPSEDLAALAALDDLVNETGGYR